jgi:hypothetical protein
MTNEMPSLFGLESAILQREGRLGKMADIQLSPRHDTVAHPGFENARIEGFNPGKGVGPSA